MTLQVGGNTVITTDRIVQLTNGATGSRPGSPTTGQLFYDTTLAKLIVWNGSAWKEAATSGSPPTPSLWGWGRNQYGNIGNNATPNRSSPVTVVGGFTDWISVSNNGNSTVALRANGSAWAWGSNAYGKLGDNTAVTKSSPVSIVGISDWVHVVSGGAHSAGIRSNGTAWSWGRASYGRLGNNITTPNQSSPVSVVGGFTDWIQLSIRSTNYNGSSFGLRANGTLWAWGANTYGMLGTGGGGHRSSPVSVVGGFTDWIQVSAGYRHILALRANGTAWAWGRPTVGCLGNNSDSLDQNSPVSVVGGYTDWIFLDAGTNISFGIRANGTAWAWGNNQFGNLGDGIAGIYRSSPVSIVGGFTDWVQIAASKDGSTNGGIRANGTAWTWGYGGQGTLGDGSSNSGGVYKRSSPVSVAGGFTDWIQITAIARVLHGIRTQPATQTVRPLKQRNRF